MDDLQLRLPFSDYPAKQQKCDSEKAERLKKTDVYVSKVDGVWNAIIPRKYNYVICAHKGEELKEFCENLIISMAEDFKLQPHFRCVRNEGIDAHFRHNQAILRSINNGRD